MLLEYVPLASSRGSTLTGCSKSGGFESKAWSSSSSTVGSQLTATLALPNPRMENESADSVATNVNFSSLAAKGVKLTDFHAITHPSQPNYIAGVAGHIVLTSNTSKNITGIANIADLLEAKGVSWTVYAEGYPGNCSLVSQQGTYYRKHNPLISFTSIHTNPKRCANIKPATELDKDIASGKVAQWVFYEPDIKNDGHDTGYAYGGAWLKSWYTKHEHFFNRTNTAVLVTFGMHSSFLSASSSLFRC